MYVFVRRRALLMCLCVIELAEIAFELDSTNCPIPICKAFEAPQFFLFVPRVVLPFVRCWVVCCLGVASSLNAMYNNWIGVLLGDIPAMPITPSES